MKRFLAVLLLFTHLLFLPALSLCETFTWQNATSYTDNTAISSAAQATITTKIYHSPTGSGTDWVLFATVTNGAMTYGPVALPSQYGRGQNSYWAMTNVIPAEGTTSAYSAVYTYMIPFVPPLAPINIHLGKP